MKKITRILALALAFVMAFALQAPVNAAEKAAVPVMDREMEATTMMTDVTNQNFAPYYKSDKEITYRVAVPSDVTEEYRLSYIIIKVRKFQHRMHFPHLMEQRFDM